jgi:hypothetical protein
MKPPTNNSRWLQDKVRSAHSYPNQSFRFQHHFKPLAEEDYITSDGNVFITISKPVKFAIPSKMLITVLLRLGTRLQVHSSQEAIELHKVTYNTIL